MSCICPLGSPMEITQQVRDYAKQMELDEREALTEGMAAKSDEFKEAGGEIYS